MVGEHMDKRELWIMDDLNDIKKILVAEGENCAPEHLIQDLERDITTIHSLVQEYETEEDLARLQPLHERAQMYLSVLQKFQTKNNIPQNQA